MTPEEYVRSIGEVGYKLTCERVVADNFHLRRAIGLHRERIRSLGLGKDGHGTEWDRELWSALYERVTGPTAEPPKPKAEDPPHG